MSKYIFERVAFEMEIKKKLAYVSNSNDSNNKIGAAFFFHPVHIALN